IIANVIAEPPQSPYDTIILDIGADSGIENGATVYALGDLPIGRVNEVSSRSAKVVLFSNSGEERQAIVERTNSVISVTGTGGGNMQATVSQDMDVTIDDKIVLPEFAGALIGQVVEVESVVTSAYKTILIRAP